MAGISGFQLLLFLSVFMHFKAKQTILNVSERIYLDQRSYGKTILVNRSQDFDIQENFVYILDNRKSLTFSKHCQIGCLALKFLMLSGDISLNPGPVKYPCTVCHKAVRSNQQGLQCDFCDLWTHRKCTNISITEYNRLGKSDDTYYCHMCGNRLPNLSDSFFEDDRTIYSQSMEDHIVHNTPKAADSSYLSLNGNDIDIFDELKVMRFKDPTRFICASLNINSLRNKFSCIKDLLDRNIVDLLFISETKIDNSFPNAMFTVDNYHLWRADRTASGRGIIAYLRSSIAGDRKTELECKITESIAVEVIIENNKWFFLGCYRPPSMSETSFSDDIHPTLDKITTKYDNINIIGDLNFDMSRDDKNFQLVNLCDVFNLANIVKQPTCFRPGSVPSLIDVFLTNKSDLCANHCNFNCGLSDMHNIIAVQLKAKVNIKKRHFISYRSFKHFDLDTFLTDTANIDFNIDDFTDVNNAYDHFAEAFKNVVDKHVPIKQKRPVAKPAPFMNKTLKQAIYKKRMLQNKYFKCKNAKNWENFRQQRNLVTSLRRKSINQYFIERCVGGSKCKNFWPTIKPFLTNKGTVVQKDTILNENGKLICDQSEVCDIFNDFFVNVAKDIGDTNVVVDHTHPSIQAINSNRVSEGISSLDTFNFKNIDFNTVQKQIRKLSVKKATGFDGLSAKMVKLAEPAIVTPITMIFNKTIESSVFPDKLKSAQVVPLHKKNSTLLKSNYRPVSILPIFSKIFERTIFNQLIEFFNQHFDPYLSAFRPGYGCQSVLLRILEEWRKALDENFYVATVLMDLSKAFDCLPHDLLLLKLQSYGLSKNALELLNSYLTNRKQCVKLGSLCSLYKPLVKGVPQGSILGPLLFNVFINDIFHFVSDSSLYNYADDNTLSYFSNNVDSLVDVLQRDSKSLIKWFHSNKMQANPEKFQAMAIGKKTMKQNISFNFDDVVIKPENEIKLLGVDIDYLLNFNTHISNICRKASRQLNVLKRIGKHFCKLGKMTIYHSFIMSNLNYCPLAWHFCSEQNTKKLEKIQERALRFIYDDFTSNYSELLTKSSLPTLKLRRMKSMALETFKILNKESPLYLQDLIKTKSTFYSFRYKNTTVIPQVRTTTYGLNSFRFSAAKLWNSLPEHFREISSFNQFSSVLSSWHGDVCKCAACKC